MYQASNGRFRCLDNQAPSSLMYRQQPLLPIIQENVCLDLHQFDVDINLECNEVIEDWDDLGCYDLFSPVKNIGYSNKNSINSHAHIHNGESFATYDESLMFDSEDISMFSEDQVMNSATLTMYDDSPPPNSPNESKVADPDTEQFYYNEIVNMIEVWRETTGSASSAAESTKLELEVDTIYKQSVKNSTVSESAAQAYTSTKKCILNNSQSEQPSVSDSLGNTVTIEAECRFRGVFSPRASSPDVLDNTSGIDYRNMRSVSPMIMRSPSPLGSQSPFSSRSSSPIIIRSYSPLEDISNGIFGLPLADNQDAQMQNEPSPDHLVPDVDNDFQTLVSDSLEFPSRRQYMLQRMGYTCRDLLVPQMPEE